MRRLLIAIATAGLWAVVAAPAAHAAPTVTGSDPADGAMEHEAPDSVTITFDLPLDDSSVIKVVDECGRQIDAENTTVTLNEMSVDIAKKPAGRYKAFYYANPPAGATGSSTGFIDFMVHGGKPCGPNAKAPHQHGGGSNHEKHKGSGGHEGHESSGHSEGTDHSTHSASGASGHTHSTSAGTHTGHTTATGHSDHNGGGQAHHHKNNGGGNVRAAGGGDNPPPTAAPGDPTAISDAQAVLISLAACLVLGVAGGWMIRTTQAPRRRTA